MAFCCHNLCSIDMNLLKLFFFGIIGLYATNVLAMVKGQSSNFCSPLSAAIYLRSISVKSLTCSKESGYSVELASVHVQRLNPGD